MNIIFGDKMSLVEIKKGGHYLDNVGDFKISLFVEKGGKKSNIVLTYNGMNIPGEIKGSYPLNFMDTQTNPKEEIASVAIRKCLEKIRKKSGNSAQALDSVETYRKLTQVASEIIGNALENHESEERSHEMTA